MNAILGWLSIPSEKRKPIRDNGAPALAVITRNAQTQAKPDPRFTRHESAARRENSVPRNLRGWHGRRAYRRRCMSLKPAADARGVQLIAPVCDVNAVLATAGACRSAPWNLVHNAPNFPSTEARLTFASSERVTDCTLR